MMKPPGVGYWWRREVFSESLGKSYPCTVWFFFGTPNSAWNSGTWLWGVRGSTIPNLSDISPERSKHH